MEPSTITADLTATEHYIPPPGHTRITPWIDPVVDRHGHDPRSQYVERFWLGTLGPTATWLLRRLASLLDENPAGFDLDMAATAHSFGLNYEKGRKGPFARAFHRFLLFGVAHQRPDGYAVRRRIPNITRRNLQRMPADVQYEHRRWNAAARTHDLADLQRGHALAAAMLAAGDDRELLEPQLVAVGIPAPTAAEVVELIRHGEAESGCSPHHTSQ